MVYSNLGHNDIDYENKTDKELSFTFESEVPNKLILNAVEWLGKNLQGGDSALAWVAHLRCFHPFMEPSSLRPPVNAIACAEAGSR